MEWGRIIDIIEKKTGKSICKELGIRPQYLSDLRSGKSKNPNSDFVLKLIETFNLNANWLLTGEGEMFQGEGKAETGVAEEAAAKIPLLRQLVSCGPGQDWESGDNIQSYIEPLRSIPALMGKNVYAFQARGISMIGLGIQDGDILFFDGSRDQGARDGIYVFGLGGEAFCKLLRFEPLENKVMIYSVQKQDLREAELIRTVDAGTDDFRIFGRVLAWLHENTVFKM
ncbi:MAG: LexA family transcriptional regulator [Treponema sp.]|nr:LexA family transcriptional regulator [Treponema sp.]